MPTPIAVKCRDCGEPIKFVRTSQGKTAPVDPDPIEVMVKRKDEDVFYFAPEAYVSHFATCPKEFRRVE
jgi:hypothetical protein